MKIITLALCLLSIAAMPRWDTQPHPPLFPPGKEPNHLAAPAPEFPGINPPDAKVARSSAVVIPPQPPKQYALQWTLPFVPTNQIGNTRLSAIREGSVSRPGATNYYSTWAESSPLANPYAWTAYGSNMVPQITNRVAISNGSPARVFRAGQGFQP